jgi:hypothetical protein
VIFFLLDRASESWPDERDANLRCSFPGLHQLLCVAIARRRIFAVVALGVLLTVANLFLDER